MRTNKTQQEKRENLLSFRGILRLEISGTLVGKHDFSPRFRPFRPRRSPNRTPRSPSGAQSISRALSCRRRGVPGRESPPAASPSPLPPIPAALWLTGLGLFPLLRRSSLEVRLIPAQHPQSGLALFRAVSPSGGRSDSI
ncbi:hypothetical protein CRG98_029627 [Punica granatum]|uniref:Uncharacterized protein n=1 Tax=Punica granatum TaxID=22663 RepID=A0A2I0J172_PUNGR|nr:hypothetical protein CRG98_029627 [Punica granatum]